MLQISTWYRNCKTKKLLKKRQYTVYCACVQQHCDPLPLVIHIPTLCTAMNSNWPLLEYKHVPYMWIFLLQTLTPGNPYTDSESPSLRTAMNSSKRFPSTYRYPACWFSAVYFWRHLVQTALITWFGPQRHRTPFPRIPVRPMGFLKWQDCNLNLNLNFSSRNFTVCAQQVTCAKFGILKMCKITIF